MDVLIKGFKTREQAEAFVAWYSNQGEQDFYNHLDICGLDYKNGCYMRDSHYDKDQITINLK